MIAAFFATALGSYAWGIEFDYVNYPKNRNVAKGCGPGVVQCLLIVSGAGSASEADRRNDVDVLTANLPRGWGFVALQPEGGGLRYSPSDISGAVETAQMLGTRFANHNLHMVNLSDGVRVGREIQQANALPSSMGLVAEIDQLVKTASPSLAPDYLAFVTYWRKHDGDCPPFALCADPEIPALPNAFSIQLSTDASHGEILGKRRADVADLLNAIAAGGQEELLRRAHDQRELLSIDNDISSGGDDDPSITDPAPGDEGPVGGGGIGVESFPLWLRR